MNRRSINGTKRRKAPAPKVARDWISDSECKKACTNHNQAHHNESKETGRSKIFAHDDTCASVRQSSGELNLDAESLGQKAFVRLLINQVDDDVPHGRPVVWRATIKPSVRFRVSSSA